MALILVEKSTELPGVTTLSLNRPEKRNALSIELLKELNKQLEIVNSDTTQRVLIIKGEGLVFCAGLDLSEVAEASKNTESAELLVRLFENLYLSPHITIATVHGGAIAGGAGIMMACDFAVAAEKTQFGFPEVRKGILPALVMIFLSRKVMEKDLKELVLLGELVADEKALQIGLINRIVPSGQLEAEGFKIAGQILKGTPEAIRNSKRFINALYPSDFKKDLQRALQAKKA
jgi:methylglutaconyl-CoA hydratase